MSFGEALRLLKNSGRVYRNGWAGAGMWVALERPSSRSNMTLPYLYLHTAQGDIPWSASSTDLLADDWEVARHREVTSIDRRAA